MTTSRIVLVLDITTSNLDLCGNVMLKFVQERMYNTPKNTIALILAGTEKTEVSQITGKVDKFKNVTVVRPLLEGDKQLLDTLLNLAKYTANSTKINLTVALEVAVRLFNQETKKTHWMSENRIMLFTDEHARFGDRDTEYLVNEMKLIKPQIVFKLIGPRLEDEDSKTLPQNAQNMFNFCNKVENGDSTSIADAVEITKVYKRKSVRQTAGFKGCLELGSELKLPLYAYTKVQAVTPQTLKMCDSGGAAVTRDRSYHLQDEHQTPVDPDCINKGYRYGKTFIPISKVDMGLMQKETDKQLKLICTTKRANIRREELLTSSAHSVTAPPGDVTAGKALSAFAVGLKEQDLVAVCRYVKKDDAKIQLCCLVPNVKDWCCTLMMVELPFANDIRKAQFSRLKAKPSEVQLAAVDRLIDSMDLSKENINTKEIPNPNIQRRFDCVVHRAMFPDSPFPATTVSQYLQLPTFSCEDIIKECAAIFGVVKTEKRSNKRTAGDMFTEDSVAGCEVKKVKKEDISLDELLGTEVKVGTTNPTKDFVTVQNKFGPKLAVQQLCEVIRTLVQHGADTAKIEDCLRSVRECCVIENLYTVFNEYLRQSYSNAVVKQVCQANLISLIHSGECVQSPVSPKESDMFLSAGNVEEDLQAALDDDDDDLLDML